MEGFSSSDDDIEPFQTGMSFAEALGSCDSASIGKKTKKLNTLEKVCKIEKAPKSSENSQINAGKQHASKFPDDAKRAGASSARSVTSGMHPLGAMFGKPKHDTDGSKERKVKLHHDVGQHSNSEVGIKQKHHHISGKHIDDNDKPRHEIDKQQKTKSTASEDEVGFKGKSHYKHVAPKEEKPLGSEKLKEASHEKLKDKHARSGQVGQKPSNNTEKRDSVKERLLHQLEDRNKNSEHDKAMDKHHKILAIGKRTTNDANDLAGHTLHHENGIGKKYPANETGHVSAKRKSVDCHDNSGSRHKSQKLDRKSNESKDIPEHSKHKSAMKRSDADHADVQKASNNNAFTVSTKSSQHEGKNLKIENVAYDSDTGLIGKKSSHVSKDREGSTTKESKNRDKSGEGRRVEKNENIKTKETRDLNEAKGKKPAEENLKMRDGHLKQDMRAKHDGKESLKRMTRDDLGVNTQQFHNGSHEMTKSVLLNDGAIPSTSGLGSHTAKSSVDVPTPSEELPITFDDIMDNLPETAPRYLPLSKPVPNQVVGLPSDVEITSKRQGRTQVYSGRKQRLVQEVPTLMQACQNVLKEHIDNIEYIGLVEWNTIEPIFEDASPMQLLRLEYYNSHLVAYTDKLWENHCKRDFSKWTRKAGETWKKLYKRAKAEQEAQLKRLTSHIKEGMKQPVKKTKLAYVDTVAKPPRDVLRRQQKHGVLNVEPLHRLGKPGTSKVTKPTPPPLKPKKKPAPMMDAIRKMLKRK